ncbi:MAG: cell division protein ZapE [Rickettsiales bacterium]|nr:cell division protein ZapE [Rickettsiales bacterium]
MADTQNQSLTQAYEALLTVDGWRDDLAQREIIAHFEELLYDLQHRPKTPFSFMGWLNRENHERFIKGIYLWGDVGRGKSMLMDLFYDHVPKSILTRRIHFHAFMTEIHEALYEFRESNPGEDDPLPIIAEDFASTCQVLCLDEFQVHDIADAMILSRLFEALVEQGVITVTTSNRPPDGLYKDGLQRDSFLPCIALLKQRFEILALDHDTDYRLEKLRGSDVYFQPAKNIKPMEKLFNSLTQHSAQASILHVKGRDIILAKTADGMAWASFSELCEAALGAEDYNTLACEFHTIFLTDIPKMTTDNRNEAKRFVLLIDAIYEHKARFICSADAPAEELYPSGDGSFEFQRTVSRLMEMQSSAYLGASHET